MNSDNAAFTGGAVFGFIVGCIVAYLITSSCVTGEWERHAIDAGAGEYNSKTREFQWVTGEQ